MTVDPDLEEELLEAESAEALKARLERELNELLQELRVRHVCERLADLEVPLADLALEAGFADQSHCTRVFKRLTGTTPGAWRALPPFV